MQRAYRWISLGLLSLLIVTASIYAQALNGPFLFDDHIHITQNRWVKIDSLSWENIAQAWDSSFSFFPNNRPLAQLSFGINHAFAGLEPWAYKTTNLVLHLLTGLAVFLFARLGYRALTAGKPKTDRELAFALLAAGFWLLAPMHVSTVLYTVQRMAQISALATTLALASYVWGRLQIARGRPGIGWMLAVIPLGAIGFLGKETTVLLPLLLLVLELTLLRRLDSEAPRGRTQVRLAWVVLILLPLALGALYFVTHPGLIHYDTRPFTLAERLLTEPRVLWFYLRLLLIPDVSRFSLYHDDLPLSTGLFAPPTTLVAIGGLVVLLVAAILLRRRYPVAAFAVLFFLAAHALESTFLALEIIFEHRNYMASVGPLMLLAYLITEGSRLPRVGRAAIVLGALLLVSHAAATWVRVESWSTYEDFILNTADNHPKSARSNFMAAQLVISTIAEADGDTSELERAGEMFLDRGLEADPNCINCLIGKVVLALHVDRVPDAELLSRLSEALKSDYVGATKVSISQFSYLVKWQQSDGVKIPPAALEKLFEDALENPRWPTTGRAGIEAAFREYHEFVSRDLEKALLHAERAIAAWPDQWAYHMHKIRVLRKLGRPDAARQALSEAERLAKNASQQAQVDAIWQETLDGQTQ